MRRIEKRKCSICERVICRKNQSGKCEKCLIKLGKTLSPITRARISEALKGRVISEQQRLKISLLKNKKIKFNCDHCGKEKKRSRCQVNKLRNFCSRKCWSSYAKGPLSNRYGTGHTTKLSFAFKSRSRSLLHIAIRQGKIKSQPCIKCGSKDSEAHHEDYRNPLDVMWMCTQHHREHERLNGYNKRQKEMNKIYEEMERKHALG